jgi:hypothetical protein
MLYLEIEHWTKEMLEKQARPGDVNLYKTGDIATSSFNLGWDPIEEDIAYWDKYNRAVVPPYDSYEEVDLFFRLSREGAHRDPDFQKQIDLVFDHDGLLASAVNLNGAKDTTLTIAAGGAMSGTITAIIQRLGLPD